MEARFKLKRDGDFLVCELEQIVNSIEQKGLHKLFTREIETQLRNIICRLGTVSDKVNSATHVIDVLSNINDCIEEQGREIRKLNKKIDNIENMLICQQKMLINGT